MSKKVSRIIGGIMLILAVAFLFVALGHPEMSFPWGNGITYTLYARLRAYHRPARGCPSCRR